MSTYLPAFWLQPSTKCTNRVSCVYPGSLRYAETLSSDLQKNILAALLRLGAVRKIKGYVGFDHPCFPGWFDWLKRQPTNQTSRSYSACQCGNTSSGRYLNNLITTFIEKLSRHTTTKQEERERERELFHPKLRDLTFSHLPLMIFPWR